MGLEIGIAGYRLVGEVWRGRGGSITYNTKPSTPRVAASAKDKEPMNSAPRMSGSTMGVSVDLRRELAAPTSTRPTHGLRIGSSLTIALVVAFVRPLFGQPTLADFPEIDV